MNDPIADAYVQWATAQKRGQPVHPPQEILVTHDCVCAMTKAWQQDPAYSTYARAAWPHLFHAWVDGLTEEDRGRFCQVVDDMRRFASRFANGYCFRSALRAIGPADTRREGV